MFSLIASARLFCPDAFWDRFHRLINSPLCAVGWDFGKCLWCVVYAGHETGYRQGLNLEDYAQLLIIKTTDNVGVYASCKLARLRRRVGYAVGLATDPRQRGQ